MLKRAVRAKTAAATQDARVGELLDTLADDRAATSQRQATLQARAGGTQASGSAGATAGSTPAGKTAPTGTGASGNTKGTAAAVAALYADASDKEGDDDSAHDSSKHSSRKDSDSGAGSDGKGSDSSAKSGSSSSSSSGKKKHKHKDRKEDRHSSSQHSRHSQTSQTRTHEYSDEDNDFYRAYDKRFNMTESSSSSNSEHVAKSPSRDVAKARGTKLVEGSSLKFGLGYSALASLYGPGIGLYFLFIKYTAILFFISAVLMIVNIVDNALGGDITTASANETYRFIFSSTGWSWLSRISLVHHLGSEVQWYQGLIVALLMLIQFIFHAFVLPVMRKAISWKSQQTEVLVEDYTIYVRGLPQDATVKEVATFFQQYGTVLFVDMPLANAELLAMCRERLAATHRLATWDPKSKPKESSVGKTECCCVPLFRKCGLLKDYKYYEDLAADLDFLINVYSKSSFKPTGTAFITFEFEYMADACIIAYDQNKTECCGCVFQFPDQSAPYFRTSFPITVKRAADPTNVMWEHLQFTRGRRIVREIIAFGISLALIAIIAYIVVTLYGLRTKYVSELRDNNFDKYGVVENVAGLILALLVVITNAALVQVLVFFTNFEQHHQRDDVELMLMLKLTVAQIVNFLALMFAVYGAPWSNIEWYNQGERLLFTLLIADAVKTNIIEVSAIPAILLRFFKGCGASSQHDLDAAYAPEPFRLAEAYAHMNKTIFLAMVFSAAMPIAPAVALLTFGLKYYVDKYALLRRNATPLLYDEDMGRVAERIFPLTIVVQGIFSALLYKDSLAPMVIVSIATAVFGLIFLMQGAVGTCCPESCECCGESDDIPMEIAGRSYLQFWHATPYTNPLGRQFGLHHQTLHWRNPIVGRRQESDVSDNTPGSVKVKRVPFASLESRLETMRIRKEMMKNMGDVMGMRTLIVRVENHLTPVGVVTVDIGLTKCWRVVSYNATDSLTGCWWCSGSGRRITTTPMTLADLRVILQAYPNMPAQYWFRVPKGEKGNQYRALRREDEPFKLAAFFLPLIVLTENGADNNIVRRQLGGAGGNWVDSYGRDFEMDE